MGREPFFFQSAPEQLWGTVGGKGAVFVGIKGLLRDAEYIVSSSGEIKNYTSTPLLCHNVTKINYYYYYYYYHHYYHYYHHLLYAGYLYLYS